jgi:hypothetical protein
MLSGDWSSDVCSSDLFEIFFNEYGKYPGVDKTDSEISIVWQSVFDKYATDVFNVMEKGDLIQLKEIYENYYISGTSEGASSGKAMSNNRLKLEKSKRNIERVKPLQEYLGLKSLQSNQFIEPQEFYNLLNEKVIIPELINYGQTWGWYYGDLFIHFELADYIYFSDIIVKMLDLLKINKTFFLGDGSGLLSAMVYNNYEVALSHHVDLGHFLLKQYLTNYGGEVKVGYHYAENFQVDFIHDSQILINQDSFPEMTNESVEKYVENAILNNVSYILSYNKEVTFEGVYTHSDFRATIIKHGYISKHRYDSVIREGYAIELFGLRK